MTEILVVDDEQDIRSLIADIIEDEGYKPVMAADGKEAIDKLIASQIGIVILDIWLEGSETDGLKVLEFIKNKYPNTQVIMISGHANIKMAVDAIKMGAYDFIEKPFNEDKLITVINRAVNYRQLVKDNQILLDKVGKPEIIGESMQMMQIRSVINKLSQNSSRIMLTGPSGCGKKTIAEIIHLKSKASSYNFVTLHPVNYDLEKFQNELTGTVDNPGLLEAAHNGTLYINEVADMSLGMQTMFLKNIQQTRYNIRIISATSKNIPDMITEELFKEDLYYRLNVMPLAVPSLSEHSEDIPLLCNYFIERLSYNTGLNKRKINDDAMAALQLYNWPGNIRQLRNVIEWLLIMNADNNNPITVKMLPEAIVNTQVTLERPENNAHLLGMTLKEARAEFEKQYITAQIKRCKGNISRAAKKIEMDRSALTRKIKNLQLTNIRQFLDEMVE
jgi:two-component system nitrogen regulation response regulator NtrX